MAKYKLHDTELGSSMEINKTLTISLIHDQYPGDAFATMLTQFFDSNGPAKTVSVKGGIIEKNLTRT